MSKTQCSIIVINTSKGGNHRICNNNRGGGKEKFSRLFYIGLQQQGVRHDACTTWPSLGMMRLGGPLFRSAHTNVGISNGRHMDRCQ